MAVFDRGDIVSVPLDPAMGHEQRDAERPQFTDHCFTGDYPTSLTDAEEGNSVGGLSLVASR